jgi:hypothetical protein
VLRSQVHARKVAGCRSGTSQEKDEGGAVGDGGTKETFGTKIKSEIANAEEPLRLISWYVTNFAAKDDGGCQ